MPLVGMAEALRARDPRAAAHSAALLLSVGTLVLAALPLHQLAGGAAPEALAQHGGAVLVLAGAALLCRLAPPLVLDRYGFGVLLALSATALVCVLNLVTRDTSAGAQAFYALPVLWAATHLRTPAVAVVTVAALGADLLTLLVLLPPAAAVTDFAFFGSVLAVMAVMLVRGIRIQEQLVAALQEQLRVDSLTGLTTRRAFDGALERALRRSGAGGTALVLIDVDSFKEINDGHGHPVGDDVLVHLATVLSGRVRAADAVLSRLGGDELAVLMPGCTRDTAVQRAEDLLEAVRSTPLSLPDGQLLALSISVGVAHMANRSTDRRGLYTAADAALYDAKRAGRGRVSVAAT